MPSMAIARRFFCSSKNVKPKSDPELSQVHYDFMKKAEQENAARVKQVMSVRSKNRLTAGCLIVSVLGIYFYSMYAVQQEDFLSEVEKSKRTN